MALVTTFTPESYLPEFAYIPLFQKPKHESYTISDFQTELDKNGIPSIIRLIDSEGNRITPFIDLSKFDADTKSFYWYDAVDNLPFRLYDRRYDLGTFLSVYPSIRTGDHPDVMITNEQYDDVSGVWVSGSIYYLTGVNNVFYRYSPIIVVSNNIPYSDLTDYANMTVKDNLDRNTTNLQFYYDFEERIYTNQNLVGVNPASFIIKLYSVGINEVNVKCVMSSNSDNRPRTTPVIDDYILKLKGQYLRG